MDMRKIMTLVEGKQLKESGFGEYVDHNEEMMNPMTVNPSIPSFEDADEIDEETDEGDASYALYQAFDEFTKGYFDAIMFTEAHSDNPELEHITIQEIALDTMANIKSDCEKFQTSVSDMGITFDDVCNKSTAEYSADELAGHDFWLTRNHHGAGFWDGDWEKEAAKKLTNLAHSFGEVWVYLGDDKKAHIH